MSSTAHRRAPAAAGDGVVPAAIILALALACGLGLGLGLARAAAEEAPAPRGPGAASADPAAGDPPPHPEPASPAPAGDPPLGAAGGAPPGPAGADPEAAAEPAALPTFDLDEVVRQLERGAEGEREAALAALRAEGAAIAPALEALLARRATATERLEGALAELDPARSRAAGRAAEPWYLDKVRRASELMAAGDHLTAIHHLDAILVLEPQCPIRQQIRGLIVRAKELLIRASVVEVRMVPQRVLVSAKEPMRFAIEVENVSEEPVRFGPGDGRVPLHGALELEILTITMGGGLKKARHLRNVEVHVAALVAPGDTTRTEVELKAFGADDPRLYRRARVRGAFRPQTLLHGEERLDRFLPVFPVDVVVVDGRRMALAADPLAALDAALAALRATPPPGAEARRAAEDEVVFAALFAPEREREAALDRLLGALARLDDPALPAALQALGALHEEPRRDRESWLRWAEERRR